MMMTALFMRSALFALVMMAFVLLTGILRGWSRYRTAPEVKAAKALAAAAETMGDAGAGDLAKARRVDSQMLRSAIASGIRAQFGAVTGPFIAIAKSIKQGVSDLLGKLGATLAEIGVEALNRTIRDVLMNIVLVIAACGGVIELVLKPLASAAQGLGPDEGARALILGLIVALLAHDLLEKGALKYLKKIGAA